MEENILKDAPGERLLLMGNEAIARGALEGGVKVATAYPGTPSSEILGTLYPLAQKIGLYAEWSTNEKIAAEVAYGAAISGLNALVAMKHYGLNVALDFLAKTPYIKTDAGLVIVVADDPQSHSSGSEQDTRFFGAYIMEVPTLEPATPQEAKDMCAYAFRLSEEYKIPVLLRSVTRVGHARQDVILGELKKDDTKPKIPEKHALIPGELGIKRHKELHEKVLSKIEEISNNSEFNLIKLPEDAEFGIITSGVGYEYTVEALELLGISEKVAVLKIGFAYPLPSKIIREFAEHVNKILVIEEGEPYLEIGVKTILYDLEETVEIHGKLEGSLPRWGELTPELVSEALNRVFEFLDIKKPEAGKLTNVKLPKRMISLCPGCPHRATGYALKMAARKSKIKVIYHGDIGCYALVGLPPLSLRDTSGAMGSSIGIGLGVGKANPDVKPIAMVGDSTFFHAGLSALANAVYTNTDVLVVVFDNGTTAMTGFQPNPGQYISISEIAKTMGVRFVMETDPYDIKQTEKVFEDALKSEGPAVVVAKHLCALYEARRGKSKAVPYTVDTTKCIGCKLCTNEFGCPAISLNSEGKATIDPVVCTGCGVCAQICPVGAIKELERRD
ncbi:indolepyruvate ferredoxin oxidoreductase subunit alpha [Thermococcus aggregans]|uniref:Indolepyruvate oxidoreductase subunit IorA n=1 Tax=Thermococcus aggregans TaxID=110163 RepID=A0A9E7MWB7_THEAG|nr:indolepyruvate ferredoxin oxidoreductase subunit alpha [Thermococcus aggregans]USS40078.1 indolepyruvate ferredoxin oxidoreductase subunit alpha [Thermococcus aggregans]